MDAMDLYLNSTDNQTCVPPQLHPTSNYVLVFVYSIICIVGLLGNTLVIYVVLRFSKMQTVTNIYIVNMAFADECFLTSIPFLVATTIVKSWPFGRAMCKIYFTVTGINQFTSSVFITIMSADRYIAICHPITSPKLRTPFISKIVALLAWTASFVMIFPVVLYADAVNDGAEGHLSCNIIWPTDKNSTTPVMFILNTFTLYSFTLTFAIPVLLILVFYVLVIRKLQTVGPKNKSKELKRSHRKVSKLVLTVITVYVLCWTPYWVGQLVLIYQSSGEEEKDGLICHQSGGESLFVLYHLITSILSTANSAMNPVLYAFLSDNFKKSFLKACVCAAKTDVNACLQGVQIIRQPFMWCSKYRFFRRNSAPNQDKEHDVDETDSHSIFSQETELTVHNIVENSVFPRRGGKAGSVKHQAHRGTSQGTVGDENNEDAHLVSKGDHSTMTTTTTTSRSNNFTCSSDANVTGASESSTKESSDLVKNGVKTGNNQATAV